MKAAHFWLAEPLSEDGESHVEPVTIVFDQKIPERPNYTEHAWELANVLMGALPGAMVDALTSELLRRVGNRMRVGLRTEPERCPGRGCGCEPHAIPD